MNDVVSLSAARAAPLPELVERIKGLLAKAESGELREFNYVAMLAGQNGYESWASKTDDCMRQVGMIDRLKHRIHRGIDRTTGENG